MSTSAVWHGTHAESFDLVSAVARNCTCEYGPMNTRLTVCAAHEMLADQRVVDHLLCVRRLADRFMNAELACS